jgi:hypothetical protein
MSREKWWMAFVFLCGGSSAFATLPLSVDEADTQDPNTFQIEAGVGYERDSVCHHYDFPLALTYGVLPQWDIAAGFGGQLEQRTWHQHEGAGRRVSGFADLNLATKWMYLKESTYLPRQTLCPSVTFPTADEHKGLGSGETDYDLTWMASKSFGEKTGVHLNLGYSFLGEPPEEDLGDLVHYGVAADYQILESLQLIGELFGELELNDYESALQCNIGTRWEIMDDFFLVASAGSRISGDAPDFSAKVGFIWVLDFNSKPNKEER